MASVDNQQTWVPYQPTKDCSQGFCSIYCPQWCYVVFPPPPPFSFADDDDDSSPTFSPLVIAIIGILASAFLLVVYYTVVSRYCGGIHFLRSRMNISRAAAAADADDDADVEGGGRGGRHHESWRAALNDGLEDSVIRAIAVCKYKKGDGFVDGTDCPVCLAEFKEDEKLRLLPKCSHAFHVHCIDTWLKSHSNCPVCRAVVVTPITTAMLSSDEQEDPPPGTPQAPIETSIVVEEGTGRGLEEENDGSTVVPRRVDDEDPNGVVEIGDDRLRRSLSIGSGEGPSFSSSSSRTSAAGEESRRTRNKALHSVMSPVQMKRSSGRLQLQKQRAWRRWREQHR